MTQVFKNSNFLLRCFPYMIGIKKVTKNYKSGKTQARETPNLHFMSWRLEKERDRERERARERERERERESERKRQQQLTRSETKTVFLFRCNKKNLAELLFQTFRRKGG